MENNNIHVIKMGMMEQPSFTEHKRQNWVNAGKNNLLFDELIEVSTGYSSTHTSILRTKIDTISGTGIEITGNIDEKATTELIDRLTGDLETVGGCAIEVLRSKAGTILELNHIPIQYLRYQKADERNNIEGMYYSRNWAYTRKYTPIFVPFYNSTSKEPRSIYLIKKYWSGNPYTILPEYYPALNWIKIDNKISNFHYNNLANGLNPGLVISMNNGIPDDTIQRKIVEALEDKYKDTDNAAKLIVMFNKDKEHSPEITQLEGNKMHEMFLLLAEQVTQQILTAHRLTNPSLAGLATPGKLAGTTDLPNSWALFKENVIIPSQTLLENGLNDILSAMNASIKITSKELLNNN